MNTRSEAMSRTLSQRQRHCLDVMDIQAWALRADHEAIPADQPVAAVVDVVDTVVEAPPVPALVAGLQSGVAPLDWDRLQKAVAVCTQCDLHASRTQTVFGVGNRAADWLVIGEAPGKDEDLQGEPFVGRAGQLLNAMLLAIGLKREQVYIANILKCRPPNNRDPRPEEVACCEAYLLRQIELIQPKIILAVGRIAAQNLLGTDMPIGKLRGIAHRFRDTGIPLVATYHPAYLLRSPAEKRKAWEDLKLAKRTLEASP